MDESSDISRKERRRSAIMDAAFDLFLEQGYNKVGMVDVIRRSGGSLTTAYGLFENKTGLLKATILDRVNRHGREMSRAIREQGAPEDVLRDAGRYLFSLLLDPVAVGLFRIIVSESMKDPDFGRYLKKSSPERAALLLSERFKRWDRDGLLTVDDSNVAAQTFIALLMHRGHMDALCGLPLDMTPDEIERHIDHVVKTILCRYQPLSGRSAPPRPDSCG